MLVVTLCALLVSGCCAWILVATTHKHSRWTADTLDGPQKLHSSAVPRVGGIAVFVGFCTALVVAKLIAPAAMPSPVALIAALLVPFVAGLYEDVSKNFSAALRLIATFIAAAIAYFACNATMVRFELAPLDAMLQAASFAPFVFTLFCVGAIAHAFNLSDGLNGLMSGLGIVAAMVIGFTAHDHGDTFVFIACSALAASVAGFFYFNFPRARLFAGDGGAYFIGTAVALLAILLVARNTAVNPWIAFLAVIYPFTDTTFAIARRLATGKSIMQPDSLHLHSLLVRRLHTAGVTNAHPAASFAIIATSAVFGAFALSRNATTLTLMMAALVYAIAYIVLWAYCLPSRDALETPTFDASDVRSR